MVSNRVNKYQKLQFAPVYLYHLLSSSFNSRYALCFQLHKIACGSSNRTQSLCACCSIWLEHCFLWNTILPEPFSISFLLYHQSIPVSLLLIQHLTFPLPSLLSQSTLYSVVIGFIPLFI